MSRPDIRLTMFLPPDDTLRVWQLRDALRPSVRWHEMMHEDHASAFTVAKITQLDLLREVRESLDRAISEGRTFEAWRDDILPELKKAGWWGLVADEKLTGTSDPIVVNRRRLETIFNTNMRMSAAAAAWVKIQREKERFPYLRYLSDHWRKDPRKDHQSWHGTILPVDDPWWQTHFPPNGWGCKCHYEQVSEERMRDRGWTVSPRPVDGQPRQFRAAGRAEPVAVPQGIHPGFGYNPGTAHLRALSQKTSASLMNAEAAGLDEVARRALADIVADPAFEQFVALPDADFPLAMRQRLDGDSERQTLLVVLSPDAISTPEGTANWTAGDLRRLSRIIENPERTRIDDSGRLVIQGTGDDGAYYEAILDIASAGPARLLSVALIEALGFAEPKGRIGRFVDRFLGRN
ncbi:phage minor head protein [Alteriqipengyuania flavescens]|uniref:phage head morphogenesis protein n=1 Tax=Alteriqipengyuania flavescens TaxID=3053610 RepID=UPI0025B5A2B0|nr:phage minor head protein [Alteriqipengyuania flavescens]WJY18712.1 phage minor head protein [Alteriqipengyuania flavescens]WJY24652.1 phage minor head protein [Alteriqipengyuania flavescens]